MTLIQADLGHTEGIAQADRSVQGSGVDILINNAGHLVQRAKLTESTEDLYDAVMNLNVKSMWFLTQAVVPSMIEKNTA